MSLTDSRVSSRADALLDNLGRRPERRRFRWRGSSFLQVRSGSPVVTRGKAVPRDQGVALISGMNCRGQAEGYISTHANVAKLADAQDLGSCPARGAGSTPAVRTRSDV